MRHHVTACVAVLGWMVLIALSSCGGTAPEKLPDVPAHPEPRGATSDTTEPAVADGSPDTLPAAQQPVASSTVGLPAPKGWPAGWHFRYEDALAEARATGKPLLVVFH
jgi:hypothetical protein